MNILEQVATHLAKQQAASTAHNPRGGSYCAYRGENGTMCAIGCLISDDEYDPDIEHNVFPSLVDRFPFAQKLVDRVREQYNLSDNDAVTLLELVQDFHDNDYRKLLKTFKLRLNSSVPMTEEHLKYQILHQFTSKLNDVKEQSK